MCAKWLFVRFGHKRFVCMVFGVILGSPWFPKNSKSGINLFGTFWDCSERFGASLVSKAVFLCAICFLYDSSPVSKPGRSIGVYPLVFGHSQLTLGEKHVQVCFVCAAVWRKCVSGKFQPMPRHFDGGRACLVMAVSLWTDRVLRVFDKGGASVALTRLQLFLKRFP